MSELPRMTRPGREPWDGRRTLLWLHCIVVSTAVATGCGTQPSEQQEGELRLTYVKQAGGVPSEAVMRCPSAGDSTRSGQEFCDALSNLSPEVFDPVDPDTACAEIRGGPQTARVVGRWKHGEVDAEFSRRNGCEIARWDAIEPLRIAAGLVAICSTSSCITPTSRAK